MRSVLLVPLLLAACGPGALPGTSAAAPSGPATPPAPGAAPQGLPPPHGDCTGLVPPPPGPPTADHFKLVLDFTGNGCGNAVAGTGTLVLAVGAEHRDALDFVSPAGVVTGTRKNAFATNIFEKEREFFVPTQVSATYFTQVWDDKGALLGEPPVLQGAVFVADDPTGGVVARGVDPKVGGPGIVSVGEDLRVRWAADPPPFEFLAIAVDRAGNTLYAFSGDGLFGNNTVAAIWFTPDGTATEPFQLLPPFPAKPNNGTVRLAARVDNGFFIETDRLYGPSGEIPGAGWVAQINGLGTVTSPPPAWLVARPFRSFHMVHGGRGYGVLPPDTRKPPDCTQAIEIFSASGDSCGSVVFPEGIQCGNTLAIGFDGTVVQQAADPDPSHQEWFGPGTCYWRWWSAIFR